MIVTHAAGAGRTARHTNETVAWACMARRSMLFSECEALDFLVLAPGAMVTMRGREGTEEIWFVLTGHADFGDPPYEPTRRVATGQLVLRPMATTATVHNPSRDFPVQLLRVAVLPPAVTDYLPARRPSIKQVAA